MVIKEIDPEGVELLDVERAEVQLIFFLLNKLSFLHNRCSVLLLIITAC